MLCLWSGARIANFMHFLILGYLTNLGGVNCPMTDTMLNIQDRTISAHTENGGKKMGLIDADALMEFTRNQKSRSVDCNDIARFPIINPDNLRPKGHWKLHPNGDATCDKCHRVSIAVWDFDSAMKFCPHCGADMRGE
jgi:hypothetical protein